MPGWKGWNEGEIRSTRSASDISPSAPLPCDRSVATMGFTSINATVEAGPAREVGIALLGHDSHVRLATVSSRSSRQLTQTIASDYLGRGENNGTESPLSLSSGLMRRTRAKKASDTGKKRAAADLKKSPKRQKTKRIPDLMPSTKSHHSEQADVASAIWKDVRRNPTADPPQTRTPQTAGYTASTSMNQPYAMLSQTSLEAIKSSGLSTTIYNCRPSSSQINVAVESACPSLNHLAANNLFVASEAQTSIPLPAIPRKYMPSTLSTQRHDQESADTQSTGKKSSRESSSTNSVFNCHKDGRVHRNVDEDLLGEDDDVLDELFTLVDSLEATSEIQVNTGPVGRLDCYGDVCTASPSVCNGVASPMLTEDDQFDNLGNIEVTDVVKAAEIAGTQQSSAPMSRARKLNTREVSEHEYYDGAFFSDEDRRMLDQMRTTQGCEPRPMVRKPFPKPILDRSPLFGVTNTTLLRTCFRLGEILNVGTEAARSKQNVLLELYARVTSSRRDEGPSRKQRLLFKDLYHDHLPHLEGTFELWQQSRVWDAESKPLLAANDEGIMCRVVGRMRRDREKAKWMLEVSSIWQATWADVDHVAGIYA